MSTVIYLANQQIQVVEGTGGKKSAQVKRYYTDTAPEGSIINGMVMDTELFIPFIRNLWATQRFDAKDVILVINSTKFVGRTMELPQLSERKTLEYIGREYADMGREEEMIYSYIPLGMAISSGGSQSQGAQPAQGAPAAGKKDAKKEKSSKNIRIYVEACEPDFISDYMEIFSHAGIKLSAVYSGECSLITFTSREATKKYRTFVLIVADAMTFSTVLWVNGSFSYYNSTRCFQEPDTPEYASDLARSVSQLTQFMQANGIEHPLECIEIAGINPDDRDMYASAINNMGIMTPVDVFNLSKSQVAVDWTLQKYLHPVSGLYDGGRMENFLLQYSSMKKRKKTGSLPGQKYFIAIGALFLLMVFIVGILFGIKLKKQAELMALEDYNNSPAVIMQITDYDMYSERNSFLTSQRDAIRKVESDIRTYPLGDTDVLEVFDRCAFGYAVVEHEAFDAKEGTIVIKASASDVESINKFIKKLMREETFSAVDYTGYELDQHSGYWNIHVTCTLAEGAGRK